jgi:hypothetical protein
MLAHRITPILNVTDMRRSFEFRIRQGIEGSSE